jgi:hypothetical protein
LACGARSEGRLGACANRWGLSTVFSGFRQLMSTSPDVTQIAAFELQVCACEGMVSNLGVLPFETSVGDFKLESLWGHLYLLALKVNR